MLSKLTVAGLHDYGTSLNDDLFEHLTLPEGIDKEILINEILKKGRSFALLYPDFEMMKLQIAVWSEKWFHNFERWVEAYNFKYEALFNVDVTTVTEIHAKASSDGWNVGNVTGGGGNTLTSSKAAYDSNLLQVTAQDSNRVDNTTDTTVHNVDSSNNDVTNTEVKKGNQGITMSQEMLLSEYNAWKWNLYDHIADVFINEFCIMMYD
ncbi:MAG: hypothetical protein J6T10_00490 [Methanobrevibacter sp.]|nr:hypothetical protein [Methanobrevibacter sp.]